MATKKAYERAKAFVLGPLVESSEPAHAAILVQEFLDDGGNLVALAIVTRELRDDPKVRPILEAWREATGRS